MKVAWRGPSSMDLADGRRLGLVDWREVPEDALMGLLRTSLGETTSRTIEFLRWKHVENPFGPSAGVVALWHGDPIAVRLFMRWQWWRGDQPIESVRAVDTATHPEWQRLGLFRTLTQLLVEDVTESGTQLVFNTPNARSRPGYLSMGWSSVGRVPVMVRRTAPVGKLVKHWLDRNRSRSVRTWVAPPGARFEDLLGETRLKPLITGGDRPADRLCTRLDERFVQWRYGAVPDRSYRAAWASDGPGGAVVIFRDGERRGFHEVVLADAWATPDEGGGRCLARALAEVVEGAEEVDYIVASGLCDHRLRTALRRLHFLPALRVGPRFTVRPLCEEASSATRWAGWRLSLGELELF